jgi:hypothetical protein
LTKTTRSARVLKISVRPIAQPRLLDDFLIEFEAAVFFNNDHYRTILVWIGRGLIGIGRLGRQRLQSVRRQGRDHHEDDQQHQQNVDQRRNVNIALAPPPPPTFIAIKSAP